MLKKVLAIVPSTKFQSRIGVGEFHPIDIVTNNFQNISAKKSLIITDMTKTMLFQGDGQSYNQKLFLDKETAFPASVHTQFVQLLEKDFTAVVVTSDSEKTIKSYMLKFLPPKTPPFYIVAASGFQVFLCKGREDLRCVFKGKPLRIASRVILAKAIEKAFQEVFNSDFRFSQEQLDLLTSPTGQRVSNLKPSEKHNINFNVELSEAKMGIFIHALKSLSVKDREISRKVLAMVLADPVVKKLEKEGYETVFGDDYCELTSVSKASGINNFFEGILTKEEPGSESRYNNIFCFGDSINDYGIFLGDYQQRFTQANINAFFMGTDQEVFTQFDEQVQENRLTHFIPNNSGLAFTDATALMYYYLLRSIV